MKKNYLFITLAISLFVGCNSTQRIMDEREMTSILDEECNKLGVNLTMRMWYKFDREYSVKEKEILRNDIKERFKNYKHENINRSYIKEVNLNVKDSYPYREKFKPLQIGAGSKYKINSNLEVSVAFSSGMSSPNYVVFKIHKLALIENEKDTTLLNIDSIKDFKWEAKDNFYADIDYSFIFEKDHKEYLLKGKVNLSPYFNEDSSFEHAYEPRLDSCYIKSVNLIEN